MSIATKIEELMNNKGINVGSTALAAAMKAHQEQQAAKVSTLLVDMVSKSDAQVNEAVQALKYARELEKQARKRLTDTVRRVEYFKATGNPLVLYPFIDMRQIARILGEELPDPSDHPEEYTVPDNWELPSDKATA